MATREEDATRAHVHVVVGILRSGDASLLCHRVPGRRWYPDVWDLPGGHVEPGERPLDALRRELREELGVEVETVSAEPVARVMRGEVRLSVFVVHTWAGEVANCCPEEHDRIGWFEAQTLGSLDVAHPFLPDLLAGLPAGRPEADRASVLPSLRVEPPGRPGHLQAP